VHKNDWTQRQALAHPVSGAWTAVIVAVVLVIG